ncbi:SH2B adapter protein 2-like isoform X2 [Scleropages formosus]|uniref:SH2B adapter protein 2-like isoform X2 n=1 Tax=Scleropages formosus TaxID=113540 RepID=UPI0008791A94|nr:SH2B adapter protein 2-like isoform X2 [Scleropages formosus]
MNGDAPASSEDQSSCPLPDWKEFCELHARTSASEFACKFRRFVRENPCYDSPGADTSFSQHFARYFLECFAAELSRAPGPGSPAEPRYSVAPFAGLQGCLLPYSYEFCQRYKDKAASSESLDSMDNRTGSAAARATSSAHKAPVLGQSRSSEDVSAGHSKVCFKKGFSLRNVSLCVVDGVREIWHRRSSPEPDGERRGSRLRLPRAVRSRKAQPMEVQREGSLRYMVADDTSCTGGSQWQKCRLLLRRTEAQAEGERFVLEFYVPPKSSKPKVSVPMSAILEVRTTMPLEMPDKDNTFVLKVDNGAEYILETIDSLQKNSWVADIQDCMDPGDSGDDIELASFLHGQHPRDLPVASSCSCELLSEGVHRPPQRSCAPVAENYITPSICSGESHFTQHPMHVPLERFLQTPVCQARGAVTGHAEEATEVEGNSSLARYPWFHGTLSRVRAAQLVLMGGARSHGLFVIRQSETRPGEYVLTFNFQGKAKHLRLSVNDDGQCHVHHLWFETVSDMLRHFHTHPIPLESGGSGDITLRCYVQAQHGPPGSCAATPHPDHSHTTSEKYVGMSQPSTLSRDPGCRSDPHQPLPVHHVYGAVPSSGPLAEGPTSSSASSSPGALAPYLSGEPEAGSGLQSRSNSSERLLEPHGAAPEDYQDNESTRRTRAVENQYSFY